MSDNYPADLLFAMAEHDRRICFAFDLTSNSFIYANPAFELFFQTPFTSATPELFLGMVHPEDLDYVKECYSDLQSGVFKSDIEFRMLLPDKKEYTLQVNVFWDDRQNERNILCGYAENISANKSHDETLNELSNKKNSILNILSHDLSGPLGSIQNLSQLLSRETKVLENEQINKYLSLIEKISKKGMHLIQEFIKQEFLESAAVPLLKQRENLADKLKGIIEEYQQSENEMGKVFHFNSTQPNIYVLIDESKFLQVINNLISNALKFTPDGGTITLSVEEKEETVLITLADTGIGIPEKFHANLFDKFTNARRIGLKGEPSVGLGMSIIKTIVNWHEGQIWFESEINKGTTFYIEIPKSS